MSDTKTHLVCSTHKKVTPDERDSCVMKRGISAERVFVREERNVYHIIAVLIKAGEKSITREARPIAPLPESSPFFVWLA